ncbi:MAG TPA: Sec-independent protein translocase protein TatB [Candidatus Limnocylindria bacterium]|nr:Sec-independent protein translocase protein TatB [Candidatus Limnocylindria bacterium]
MFDIGWQELLLIAVIAIIVISPKDLPHAIRAVSQFARQLRGLSREFRNGVSELVREADLDELKHQIQKVEPFEPLDTLTSSSDPTRNLSEDGDSRQFAQELKRRVNPEAPSTVDAVGQRTSGEAQPDSGAGTHEDAGENSASVPAHKKTSV